MLPIPGIVCLNRQHSYYGQAQPREAVWEPCFILNTLLSDNREEIVYIVALDPSGIVVETTALSVKVDTDTVRRHIWNHVA